VVQPWKFAPFKKALEKAGERLIGIVAGEKVEIFEKVVDDHSKINGKNIGDLQYNFIIGAAYRNGELIKITNETRIEEGDVLVICVPVEEVKKISALF
jgi:Trk K+ transport system NAD-binding subunit